MARTPLALVLNYRDTGKIAFHVLVGALETDPETRAVPIEFVRRTGSLEEAAEARLRTHDRVVVGWSFFSTDFAPMAARLAEFRARIQDPAVLHLAGGVHASADPAGTLRAGFDYVAVGEGERTIVELVRALLRGGELAGVRGLAHLDGQGRLAPHSKGEFVDLNAWPPFAPEHDRLGPIEITRGCIYACKFCQTPFLNRARFRHRSVENVCRWVRFQKERGYRDYRFLTPTSLSYGSDDETPRLDRVEELLSSVRGIIGREGRLYYGTFPSEVRPEHVTPEALAVLKRWVDNDTLIVGGQSGSERVLASSRRGHDAAVIERAVALAKEAGFQPHVDFLFGLPGEEPDDVAASLRLAQALVDRGARVHGHAFMPLPGTPYQNEPAGRIDAETRRSLDRMASRGSLYGQWKRQLAIGRRLEEQRGAKKNG